MNRLDTVYREVGALDPGKSLEEQEFDDLLKKLPDEVRSQVRDSVAFAVATENLGGSKATVRQLFEALTAHTASHLKPRKIASGMTSLAA